MAPLGGPTVGKGMKSGQSKGRRGVNETENAQQNKKEREKMVERRNRGRPARGKVGKSRRARVGNGNALLGEAVGILYARE